MQRLQAPGDDLGRRRLEILSGVMTVKVRGQSDSFLSAGKARGQSEAQGWCGKSLERIFLYKFNFHQCQAQMR